MVYNPYKELTPTSDLSDMPFLIIERQPDEIGDDWVYHQRLIENILNRHEEVEDCAVDVNGEAIYVTLSSKEFDEDDIERIEAHLREAIGRVACFSLIK